MKTSLILTLLVLVLALPSLALADDDFERRVREYEGSAAFQKDFRDALKKRFAADTLENKVDGEKMKIRGCNGIPPISTIVRSKNPEKCAREVALYRAMQRKLNEQRDARRTERYAPKPSKSTTAEMAASGSAPSAGSAR